MMICAECDCGVQSSVEDNDMWRCLWFVNCWYLRCRECTWYELVSGDEFGICPEVYRNSDTVSCPMLEGFVEVTA